MLKVNHRLKRIFYRICFTKFILSIVIVLVLTFAWQKFSLADQESLRFKDPSQEMEMIQLQAKILAAGIDKVHITMLKAGTIRKILGINTKKILAWNSAGRRLYSSIKAAQNDGFVVWEFGPNSEAVRFLENMLRKEGGKVYSDDLLYIMWEGLEFTQQ